MKAPKLKHGGLWWLVITLFCLVTKAFVLFMPGGAKGSTIREYSSCMRLARIAPTQGFETALKWIDTGGGNAAKHCAAAALFSMEQYSEAAERFGRLARIIRDDPAASAGLLAQEGQAWHQANDIDRAYTAYSAALELTPRAAEIRIDRAMISADEGQYWKAIDDLNIALEVNRDSAEALVLRASAYRYVGVMELAFDDVSQALKINPDLPEALLERGILYRLENKREQAREDWLKLLRLYEGTPAATAARQNLEKLDIDQE